MKRLFKVDYLSRAEGETGITAEMRDGEVTVRARVFEAPRFFEALLRGRHYCDVADFTARICGICPVAYQMSAVHAIEMIFGVEVEEPIRELRRLLYCGEWIQSHALHSYLLQGPDFYGAESAWSKKEYLSIARRGLFFQRLGNRILTIIGGRPVHPVSVKVGGFSKVPGKKTLAALSGELEAAYDEALKAISWAARLPFSDNARDREYFSLRHPGEYPMNHGHVCSNKGLEATMDEFPGQLGEYQVDHSTAFHAGIQERGALHPYLVGPLARVNLNHDRLPREIGNAMKECGIQLPVTNSHMGIISRSIELAYALGEAVRIIRAYEPPDTPAVELEPRAGEATWITEAPRGMLIHNYELDDGGYVKSCKLIPPTSQNLAQMERDLRDFLIDNISKPADFLKKESEKMVRSYDPCISCAVHLVDLR